MDGLTMFAPWRKCIENTLVWVWVATAVAPIELEVKIVVACATHPCPLIRRCRNCIKCRHWLLATATSSRTNGSKPKFLNYIFVYNKLSFVTEVMDAVHRSHEICGRALIRLVRITLCLAASGRHRPWRSWRGISARSSRSPLPRRSITPSSTASYRASCRVSRRADHRSARFVLCRVGLSEMAWLHITRRVARQ